MNAPSPDAAPADQICVPSRNAYCKVNALLFAASNRAFLYQTDPAAQEAERAKLLKDLDLFSPGAVSDAPDWDMWRAQIAKDPNLLVLVAHTEKYRGGPALEIGDKKFLGQQEIVKGLFDAAGEPRLLILLGCSAAGVTDDFQPYPELFHYAGIKIVLAPVAPIRGADAVPIARRLTQLLAENLGKPQPTAFGDLLPLLRRRLLLEGHPGVMGIVGFGDGDWLLGGQPC